MGSLYIRQYHIGFMISEKDFVERLEKAGEALNIKNKNDLFKKMLQLGLSAYEKSNSDVPDLKESLRNIVPEEKGQEDSSGKDSIKKGPDEFLTAQDAKEWIKIKKIEHGLEERLYGDVLLIKSMVSSIFELLSLKSEDPNFIDKTEIIPYLFKIGGYSKTPEYLKEIEQEFLKRDD